MIPLLILGVPLLDTVFAIIRRARRRTGVATADKAHLHHRLMDLGHGHRRTVVILWAWTALLCGFVLVPVYTSRGNGIVPIGLAALGLLLFTLFAPVDPAAADLGDPATWARHPTVRFFRCGGQPLRLTEQSEVWAGSAEGDGFGVDSRTDERAGSGAGRLTVVDDLDPADEDAADSDRSGVEAARAAREVVDHRQQLGLDRFRIEQDEVGVGTLADLAPVGEPEQPRRVAGSSSAPRPRPR